ncbi:MAG TPA: xanthine dehydrogenase family protein molybdopterin-binding subunit [Candidatus Limnocylindria bacterium]|nr:xanthine dehydrogenase family protein molybdopterin-binding subunit [Candidatus Limnocylindria bacterium]
MVTATHPIVADAGSVTGRAVRRLEDPRFVTGAARYVGDLNLPRQVHLAFVRSPYAHARLLRIDVAAASAVQGVVGVFTGDDLAQWVRPIRTPYAGTGYLESDWPVVAVGKVRFVGEAVAVVAAIDRYVAEDAADLVEVEYEPLRAVVTIEDGLSPEAPRIHDELPDNLFVREQKSFGDVDAQLARAAHVVEATFRTQRSAAAPIECRGSLADHDAGTGRTTLWTSTQLPHVLRYGLADCLGVAESELRVVGPDVGGGFGNKANMDPEQVVVCALARRLGRPVKWIEDRRENFLASTHGQEERIWLRLSADPEGRFLSLESDIVLNGGAYSIFPDTPCNELLNSASCIVGPYALAHYRYNARAVVTTTCPHGPIRGVARSQANFAMERLVDMLARKMGIDGVELRRRNLLRPEQMPFRTVTGLERDSGDYVRTLEMAIEGLGWDALRARQRTMRGTTRIGLGVASFAEECAVGTVRRMPRKLYSIAGYDGALIRFDVRGHVTVLSSAAGMGQGIETSLAQLAADELGVEVADITVRHNDTDLVPYGMGSTGSRTAVSSGGAVLLAARKLREKLLQLAAHLLDERVEGVGLRTGEAYVLADPSHTVSVKKLAWVAYRREGSVPAGFEPGLEATAFYDPPSNGVSSNASHAAAVEVDTVTGKVRVIGYVVAEDAGRMLNPLIVEGQIRGGATQGIAKALFEQVQYDGDGQLANASFMDFLIPTMGEICPIDVLHMETPSPLTVGGMKGCGESGIIGAPAAIGNAIVDALDGVGELYELPFTPERVRALARGVT